MKPRIPLLIVLSLLIALFGYTGYRIIRFVTEFEYPEVSWKDGASIYSRNYSKRLLVKMGYRVKTINVPYNRDDYSVIVRSYGNGQQMEQWREWARPGRRLILLCLQPEGIAREHPIQSGEALFSQVNNLYFDPSCSLSEFSFPPNAESQTTVLGSDESPSVVRETFGSGEILYIADKTIFSDRSVIEADNAVFLNNCFKDRRGTTILFDESYGTPQKPTQNTEGENSTAFFLFRGVFLCLFLQVILLTVIFFLVSWKRFGPVLDMNQFVKRSLLGHLEATGCFFEKSKNPLVIVDILDRHFFSRLRENIRFLTGQPAEMLQELKKRIPLEQSEEDIFTVRSRSRVVERDARRERFILRIKGVKRS